MRTSSSFGKVFRAAWKLALPTAALLVVGSGCQLVTGSYTADGLGPDCTKLASCCGSLGSSDGPICLSAVEQQNESVCEATLTGLPPGACIGTSPTGPDGGSNAETGTHAEAGTGPLGDAAATSDARPDSSGERDSSPSRDSSSKDSAKEDVEHEPDAPTSVDLNGNWTLSQITCDGSAVSVGVTSDTLIVSTGSAVELTTYSDGCSIAFAMESVTISATDITAADSNITCGEECTSADGCTPGDSGAVEFPYTLSGGTLALTEGDSSCSAGVVSVDYTRSSP